MNLKHWLPSGFAIAAALALSACQAYPRPTEITVYAAASLTDAFTQIADGFEVAHPDLKVVLNFGGSSQLATQIQEGMAADVFASASVKQINLLAKAGLTRAEPLTFATNQLVIIVPASNPAHIFSVRDLSQPGLTLVLASPGVPVRDYTDQAFAALAANPSYGQGFVDQVVANLASEEENVRQVVARVTLGEADVGVVYRSDVTREIADTVKIIPFPASIAPVPRYLIVQIAGSKQPQMAQQFIDFVLSPEGQHFLEQQNFLPPP